jgi:ATP-dependent Clp protease ATP-binding subunit ClpC
LLAQEEGRKAGSDQILPEHILLALLKSADGLGYILLRRLRIDLLTLQLLLEQSLPSRSGLRVAGEIIPSQRLRGVLDDASMEARSMRLDYIGTEHIVMAAAKEEQSVLWQFFRKSGVSPDDLRRAAAETVRAAVSSANDSVFSRAFVPYAIHSQGSQSTSGGRTKAKGGILQEFSRDITALAREGGIDPVVGRDREIQRVVQILSRRTKNNPVLIGDPGVGKTAIAEGLALRIANGTVPRNLLEKRLLTLDVAQIIAGTKYRGEFEERIKRIIKEITEQKDAVLFIDELHTIIGAGGAEGTMDASNMLKPALARGELQCIGATTLAEYRKYFERDAALERRFQIVQVAEPTEEETREILKGIKKKYEAYHNVTYSDESIEAIARFACRYITGRYLPDKAIDILDETGAMKKIEEENRPPEIEELEAAIERLSEEKKILVQNQDYERAAEVRDKTHILRQKLDSLRSGWERSVSASRKTVCVRDVCAVVETMTGIPASDITASESRRLLDMEKVIHKELVGQDEAVSSIAASIRRSRAGVSSDKRPSGSFVFLGPTGVGKTQAAKTLARFLFGSEDSLIRIDMSDFMEKHNTSRLVGAPPGYIGYEEGGVLTEKVRRKPYSVVLLDEIEKAHPDVFNILLQILEEGELQDNLGHTVSFRNAVIIMTSNAGTRQISSETRLGFDTRKEGVLSYEEIKSSAMNEIKKILSPELLNRIDEVVVFNSLTRKEVEAILDIRLEELSARLAGKQITMTVTKPARDYLAENGYSPQFGARPMRRLIQRDLEDALATMILTGDLKPGDAVTITCSRKKIKINRRERGAPSVLESVMQPPVAAV